VGTKPLPVNVRGIGYSAIIHHLYLIPAYLVGKIVMGAARGIAAGLEEGLYQRVAGWLVGWDAVAQDQPEEGQPEDEHQEPGDASGH
jgi:hypothetical protein